MFFEEIKRCGIDNLETLAEHYSGNISPFNSATYSLCRELIIIEKKYPTSFLGE